MKQTAYGTPILIQNEEVILLNQVGAINEASIQELVFKYPSCLPISEIDESFNPVLPVCTELNTPVGPLDILMVSPSGELIIIETKLWKNPEARRVVVAQILDYAKELSKWSYDDLQREINRRLKTSGNTLYEIVKKSGSNQLLNESDFVDSVSRNLRKGNFLLLIVGDGIREGAAGIAEFLISSGYMNFTFAMIELAVYKNDDIGTILLPRVITKTVELQKISVDIPDGLVLISSSSNSEVILPPKEYSREWLQERKFYFDFWTELIGELSFDDPGQPLPKPGNGQNIFVYPGKTRKAWISAYFMKSQKRVGVYFNCQKDSEGQRIYDILRLDKDNIEKELGEEVTYKWNEEYSISLWLPCDDVFESQNRDDLKNFFKEWLNTFVNVIRPRIKKIEKDNSLSEI
ncbi:MAG: DUF4268 domain-containing protein [Candidatus Cloacimonetes bacterium]|nr:DUF4268 domain-containing protein [Candidatus Cloacimonadota bacterium]